MGKRFLAEWHPQAAIQLAWPHADSDWLRLLPQIEGFYCELVDTLSHQQLVVIAGDPRLDRPGAGSQQPGQDSILHDLDSTTETQRLLLLAPIGLR